VRPRQTRSATELRFNRNVNIPTGIALFLFAGALLNAAGPPSDPAAGRWEGIIDLTGRQVPVVLDLDRDRDGHWIGSAIFPGLDVKGTPLADLVIQDGRLSCTVKGALGGPKLDGRLATDGGLEGSFELAGNSAPFSARKSGAPQVDPPRQSTAVRPDFIGEWQGELKLPDHAIQVKLSLANRDGKAAAALTVSGSPNPDVAVDLVTQDSDTLSLEMNAASATYDGVLRPGVNEIDGTVQLSGAEFPLVFHRAPANEAKQ